MDIEIDDINRRMLSLSQEIATFEQAAILARRDKDHTLSGRLAVKILNLNTRKGYWFAYKVSLDWPGGNARLSGHLLEELRRLGELEGLN